MTAATTSTVVRPAADRPDRAERAVAWARRHGDHRRSRSGCSPPSCPGFSIDSFGRRAAGWFRRRRRQRRRLAGAGVPRRPALGADARPRCDRPQRVFVVLGPRAAPGRRDRRLLAVALCRDRPRHRHHRDHRVVGARRRGVARPAAVADWPASAPRTPTSPTCPASCSSNSTASPTACCGGRSGRATCPPCTVGCATAATISSSGRPGGRRRPASANAGSCTARRPTCRRSAGSTRPPARSSCPTIPSARRRSSRPTRTATVCSPTTARATATCSPATPSGRRSR